MDQEQLQRIEKKLDKVIEFFSIDGARSRRPNRELDELATSVVLRLQKKEKKAKAHEHANQTT